MPNNLREALSNAQVKADWIGFREVRETSAIRYARDGHPEMNHTETSHGVMVEVLVNGQFGYSSTSRLDPESLNRAVEQAHLQAVEASKWAIHPFTSAQRPPIRSRYQSPTLQPFSSISAGDINQLLVEITRRMKKSPKIIRTTAMAAVVETQVHFVSSNGSDAEQEFSSISTEWDAIAQEGSVTQKRSGSKDSSHQGGWEHLYTSNLWTKVDLAANQALELLSAEECPTETMDLVLMPDQMMLQIHGSIGHPLELDRILGDERNYAGWSFVKPQDFGKLVYGSPKMNVTFDPTVPGEFASYAFDDNGNNATREFLIKDGILKRGLGGIESQARSGIPGVANARASSWNRAPIDRMANINLEPGSASFDEIISSVERGVLMESNRSWSIDDFRNKFQFGCEYGKLIENGKITRTVRNPNYRGVTVPFWNNLKKVGSPATRDIYGTPNCGKGEPNQAIRVGHASPVCLFGDIEVFGGA